MSRDLRLRATGERLVWKFSENDWLLACESVPACDTRAWYAGVDSRERVTVYDHEDWDEARKIFAADANELDGVLPKVAAERALVAAGVAEYIDDEEPFPSD